MFASKPSILAITIIGLGMLCCRSGLAEPEEAVSPPQVTEQARDLPGLHNVLVAQGNYFSGSEPHGEEAFATLKALGVKTIISVDGVAPDVATAGKYGLRYIHIPFGYDGVDASAQAALTRVAKEVKGPIYVHCHHGKHRGPAGAAVLCQAAGLLDHQGGLDLLKRAGTSEKYRGLFRDVAQFQPLPDDARLPELVEKAELGDMAAGMAILDRRFDALEAVRDNNWKPTADHPDIVAMQEALLIKETFRELARGLKRDEEKDLHQRMKRAERLAESLEKALQADNTNEAARQVELLTTSCAECHTAHRN